MEELMKSFERYYATDSEMEYLFNTEFNKEEYDELNKNLNKKDTNGEGERFISRKYLSDFYSQLTEEQKKFIAKFQVILASAILEDKLDREYNIKNYEELNNNLSMKGGIKIGN
jgi:hypothetical protein